MTRRLPLPFGVEYALLGGAALALGLLAGVDPVIAVAAALSMAFALVVLIDITAGLCLFVVLIFLDQIPTLAGAAVSSSKLAGLLLAFSWLAFLATHGSRRRNFIAAHGPFTLLLVVFLGWATLSLIWVESLADGGDSVVRYSLNVLLFLIVFTAVDTRRRALAVSAAFVAAATLSAVYGLLAPADLQGDEALTRFAGSVADPNEFAALAVAALMLAASLGAAAKRSPGLRLGAIVAAGLCTASVFLTLSRGGLIALAVGLVAAVVVVNRGRWVVVGVTLVVALGGLAYFTVLAPSAALERVTSVDSGSGREDIWAVGWRMVEAHPVRGVGSGNFQRSSVHYLLQPGAIERNDFIVDTPEVAHNIYLQVLAELGVVGLALFVAILLFSLACALKAALRFDATGDRGMAMVARGVFLALLSLLAAYFFVSEQYSKQLWLLLGLGPSLLAVASTGRGGPARTRGDGLRPGSAGSTAAGTR